jgi:hypothetical protein
MCAEGRQLLKTLVELDLSHNKYLNNECADQLIRTTSKIKRIKAPLKIYLSQTGVDSEHFQRMAAKRVELIF